MTHSFRGFPPLGVGAVAFGPERGEHMPGGFTLSKVLQLGAEERERGGDQSLSILSESLLPKDPAPTGSIS